MAPTQRSKRERVFNRKSHTNAKLFGKKSLKLKEEKSFLLDTINDLYTESDKYALDA